MEVEIEILLANSVEALTEAEKSDAVKTVAVDLAEVMVEELEEPMEPMKPESSNPLIAELKLPVATAILLTGNST